jgi:aryl-alcohol dehydrogenase-like predicted oxidoreductase
LAKKRNVSMAQIATAWILAKDAVVAPIVGTTRLENLYDIIGLLTAHIIIASLR